MLITPPEKWGHNPTKSQQTLKAALKDLAKQRLYDHIRSQHTGYIKPKITGGKVDKNGVYTFKVTIHGKTQTAWIDNHAIAIGV